LNQLIAVTLNL